VTRPNQTEMKKAKKKPLITGAYIKLVLPRGFEPLLPP
jgi:hypothetical protein